MKSKRISAVLVLLFSAHLALCQEPQPTITLRTINGASVSRHTLQLAEKQTRKILGSAGISLVWRICEPGRAEWGSSNPCQRERGLAEFWVTIVTRRPHGASTEMLGFTEMDESVVSNSAGVYYPAAVELASRCQTDVGSILGAAIAHEVGHLILGANAHTPRGVMTPKWGLAELERIGVSGLGFTPEQATMLQSSIRSRSEARCNAC